MSDPVQIDPLHRCRRCEHPYAEHREENLGCSVEFGKAGRVPTTAFGGTCPCPAFVFETEQDVPPPPDAEKLDGPAMYAEGLGYLRMARSCSGGATPHIEREALDRAGAYFAGAAAFVLGRLAIDNGTGDLEERRWLAALAGEDVLPEEDATA